MTRIQRVIEARRKNRGDKPPSTVDSGGTPRGIANVAGIFSKLAARHIHSGAMEKNKILPAVDDRAAVTAYKMLRTRVLHRMRANHWQTLIVTAAGAGEGKTLTSCNLAVSIANDVNQSVLLVDLDLQRPTLASYFGLEVQASIGDYLTGEAEIDDILYAPEGMERIGIIPNRDPVANASELVASPRMRTLLEWVKNQGPQTITIFDMPPVLACDDVLAFSPYADAILMVVAEGHTERNSVARAMEMLGECNLVGVVLNQSRERNTVSSYY